MRYLLAILLPCLLLAGCEQQAGPVFRGQVLAFGTVIDITIDGVERSHAEQVAGELEQMLLGWHRDWHAWEPGLLTETNRQLASGKPFTVDPALLPLLVEANRLSSLSNGLFNPLIGGLLSLWGFQGNPLPEGTLPDADAIAAWLARAPAVTDIELDGDRLLGRNPLAAYDLGGFAKGYAIDRCIEHLRARGIDNAIVNTGGDLRAIGTRSDRRWRIGIRHPREDGILASIDTDGDDSVFTSGDYERLFEVGNVRYHHILDPRTGYPASGTAAVTVVHDNAGLADAAATALFVAGPEGWRNIARRMGIRHVMFVDREGTIHVTPAMRDIITLSDDVMEKVRLTDPL
ncbi:MAG: FAD:protein FMN transferase [Thiohalobacterales bacterium]|nr:FAD:protein FMN transferase [Thiohalobacterales bacterium]